MHKQRKCPSCGSEDVEPDISEMTSYSHGDSSTWICNSCGIRGIFPTKENKVEEKDREKNEQMKTEKPIFALKNLKTISVITAFLILLLALTVHLN